MWPFSSDKKPVEITVEVKEKYTKASIDELKKEAVALKAEHDNPGLTTGKHISLLGWGVFISPESLIGQVVGWFGAPRLAEMVGKRSAINLLKTEAAGSAEAAAEVVGHVIEQARNNPMFINPHKNVSKYVNDGLIKKGVDTQKLIDTVYKHRGIAMIGGSVILGAVLGLNAYRRYANDARAEKSEEADAKLKFVEKLLVDREAPTKAQPIH